MIKREIICIVLFHVSFFWAAGQYQHLVDVLPEDQEIAGWISSGVVKIEKTDYLFQLNPEQAELFLEYGFLRLISARYENKQGSSLRIDIYEMESPDAAFGIYSLFRADETFIESGRLGTISDVYARFQAGSYLVFITPEHKDPQMLRSMMRFAAHISGNINVVYTRPHIVSMLPDEGFISTKVSYFRGNLGLSSVYLFSHENIFEFEEGVCGDYGGYMLIILKYSEDQSTDQMIPDLYQGLKKIPKFTEVSLIDGLVKCVDNKQNQLFIDSYENFLLLFIGADSTLQPELFEQIKGEEDDWVGY
jgi:hypothetical protein